MRETTDSTLEHPHEARWRESRRALRAWFLGQTRDPSLAEDLTQEVFVKALSRLDGLRDSTRFDAWLWTIARNTLTDAGRRKKQHAPLEEDAHAAPAPELEEQVRRALASCLPPMIATLPEPYRSALEATHLEGLTQQELADREAISLSGAKSRVQRARQLLKGSVESCCQVELDHAGRLTDVSLRGTSCRCGVDT